MNRIKLEVDVYKAHHAAWIVLFIFHCLTNELSLG